MVATRKETLRSMMRVENRSKVENTGRRPVEICCLLLMTANIYSEQWRSRVSVAPITLRVAHRHR